MSGCRHKEGKIINVVLSCGVLGGQYIATTSLQWSPICNTQQCSLQGTGVENVTVVGR